MWKKLNVKINRCGQKNVWIDVKPLAGAAGWQWRTACQWQERRKRSARTSYSESSWEARWRLQWGRRHWSLSRSGKKSPTLAFRVMGGLDRRGRCNIKTHCIMCGNEAVNAAQASIQSWRYQMNAMQLLYYVGNQILISHFICLEKICLKKSSLNFFSKTT